MVVPDVKPLTAPDTEPTVATEALPLDHTPPDTTFDKVTVEPMQMLAGPVIKPAVGAGTTVTMAVSNVTLQPLTIE